MTSRQIGVRAAGPDGAARIAFGAKTQPLLLGVIVFLASEMMFFAGLFAAYYNLRSIDSPWPPADVHLDLVYSTCGTFLLAASDGTMILTQRALERAKVLAAYRWLIATIVLGAGFLVSALDEWQHAGLVMSSHAYASLFFTMTGFHAFHVFSGVVLLSGLLVALVQGAYRRGPFTGADALAYYWHFVFIVWIGIYLTIFWVR
jgi:cytochrome c oxidase subunit III